MIGVHWCRSMLLTLATIAAGITRWKAQQYDRGTLVQVNVTYPGYNCGRYNQVEGTTVRSGYIGVGQCYSPWLQLRQV